MTSFDCSNNQITKLDVSKNTSLQTLSCYGNDLQLLDFSNCKNLTTIYLLENGKNVIADNSSSIEGSYMMTIDKSSYSNLVLSFANTQILQLNCINNESLQSIDISKNDQLAIMRIESNPLLEILDVTKNSKLEILYCTNNKLSGLDVSQNPILSTLDCSGNEIPQLDVMNNPQLTSLDCSSNQIGSLNLSKNTLLTTVNCSSNQLQSLIVRNNVALVDLNCSNNQLTVLDVTKNTELEKLNCSNNNLSTLDLRQNTKLTSLDCSGNENLVVINIMTNWNPNNISIVKYPKTQLIDDENKRHYCIGDYWEENNIYAIVYRINDDFGYTGNVVYQGTPGERDTSVLQDIRSVQSIIAKSWKDLGWEDANLFYNGYVFLSWRNEYLSNEYHYNTYETYFQMFDGQTQEYLRSTTNSGNYVSHNQYISDKTLDIMTTSF